MRFVEEAPAQDTPEQLAGRMKARRRGLFVIPGGRPA